jgi:hypothetical protein
MTATLKRKVHRKTTVLASEPGLVNTFTLIRECATKLANATPRYRRARDLLTVKQLENFFLEGAVDPEFTEQQKSASEAGREVREQLCYIAEDLREYAGTVLLAFTRGASNKTHTLGQFEEIAMLFAGWHACEQLLDFGELSPSMGRNFPIPSDAKLDAINANLATLLAVFREDLIRAGFTIPGD